MDLYTATVARATGRETIPRAEWEDVRVFVPLSQRIKVKQSEEFERTNRVRAHRLFPEDLSALAGKLLLTFRESMASELAKADCLAGAHLVWSMLPGYLDERSGVRLRSWLGYHAVPLTELHSSGHASVSDLQRFAAAIDARALVPIHTREAARYPDCSPTLKYAEMGNGGRCDADAHHPTHRNHAALPAASSDDSVGAARRG